MGERVTKVSGDEGVVEVYVAVVCVSCGGGGGGGVGLVNG